MFQRICFQTLVGWTASYIAGIGLNAPLGQKWNDKLWLPLGSVSVVRILVDLAFAEKKATRKSATKEHR